MEQKGCHWGEVSRVDETGRKSQLGSQASPGTVERRMASTEQQVVPSRGSCHCWGLLTTLGILGAAPALPGSCLAQAVVISTYIL